MKLPIVAYGDPMLRKVCEEIPKDYSRLHDLIENMFETMYAAPGVGLAAPQVGLPICLFVVDSLQLLKEEEEDGEEINETGYKGVFINAKLIETQGGPWVYEEGCLSIPGIREDVTRDERLKIQFYDEQFNLHEKEFSGITGRVVLHEYDHTQGKLFTDYLPPLRKRMLKNKLDAIAKGRVKPEYKMRFPGKRV